MLDQNTEAQSLTRRGLDACRRLEQLIAAEVPDRGAIADARRLVQFLADRLVDCHAGATRAD
jgi:hypothetical protein